MCCGALPEIFDFLLFIDTLLCCKEIDNIQMSLGQVVYDDADCVELVRQVRSSGKVLCGVAIK